MSSFHYKTCFKLIRYTFLVDVFYLKSINGIVCFQEMVVGARFPGVEMTESRLQAMAAARSLLDSLPYKLDAGLEALKAVNSYDHNKNSISDTSKDASRMAHGPPSSTSHLQPFTAPWLAEVARITPARPEHLPFVHPTPPGPSPTTLQDYYPHFANLPPRSTYYNHPMFSAPHPYLRDYHPRQPLRPYPLLDPRHAGDIPNPRSPPNPSHIIPQGRPLGPPPPPPPPPVPDVRDLRMDSADPTNNFSRSSLCEPSPKRRFIGPPSNFSPIQSSSSSRLYPKSSQHLTVGESSKARSPDHRLSTSSRGGNRQHSRPSANQKTSNAASGSAESSSSYYPHFQKGALVAIGDKVRRVEDMRTEDFVEAADAADDLTLDPPSVSSIVMSSSGDTATVVFNFASRKEEVG